MFSASRAVWMLVNAAGLLAFLLIASNFWIEPELAEVPGASGGAAFGWAFNAAPILILFVVANVIWLAIILLNEQRGERLRSAGVEAMILLCWLVTFYFDNAHHGI